MARHPILTGEERVYGYELLFRGGVESCFASTSTTTAARIVLDSGLLIGFDVLCDGRRALIKCTREILVKDCITLLPPAQTVVVIPDSVPADPLVTAACKRLKVGGYLIALQNFTVNDPREPLAPLADIIKIDFAATPPEQSDALAWRYSNRSCRMLAENVETRDQFAAAKKAGFAYFQGFFFRKPETIAANRIPANKVNYLRMLQAASRPELDPREIEKVIKSEASLCYRLLRYLNSAAFGFSGEISSVRHALSMLGQHEIRRWIRLVAMLSAGQHKKSSDLVLSALVRARFCELLSPKFKQMESDLFLMGLVSLMDGILGMPMSRVLEAVPLDKEIRATLLGEPSRLQPIYKLMVAQEAGDWEQTAELSKQLRLTQDEVSQYHWQAMQWAQEANGSSNPAKQQYNPLAPRG